jgi:hypothetical protein
MTRARALVAAVPPRVWAAVAGLVLLASLGVTLVLGAGLATWRGGVTHQPVLGSGHAPATVLPPPGSAIVVVPTPGKHSGGPVAPPGTSTAGPSTTVTTSTGAAPGQVGAAPVLAPAQAPPPVATPPTTQPRVVGPGPVAVLPHTAPGRANKGASVPSGCSSHGKHLGWSKHGASAAAAHGRAVGHLRRHTC